MFDKVSTQVIYDIYRDITIPLLYPLHTLLRQINLISM